MSRIYQEYFNEREKNPLYQISMTVGHQLRDQYSELNYDGQLAEKISLAEFSCYLVFEAVSQWVKDHLKSETTTIYRGVIAGCDTLSPINEKAEPLKDILYDFNLRREFMKAKMARHNILWNDEELKWMQKGNKNAYNLTPLQMQQLYDKDVFNIKRVNELRRFINPKHAPIDDVIRYYRSLISYAGKCRNEPDPKKRVIYAIKLNDFENESLSLFLYYVAKYCADCGIKEISNAAEKNLLALTCSISIDKKTIFTHKPVVYIRKYIPAALHEDPDMADQHITLELLGLYVRSAIIPELLNDAHFSYQDIDDFICRLGLYDIFHIYSDIDVDDNTQVKKTISILRRLIDLLTVDPLSTSP